MLGDDPRTGSSMSVDLAAVDLVGAEAVRDPHAVFARLREHGGGKIQWLPRHKAWLLTDFDLVKQAIQDEAFSTDMITALYSRLTAEERERFKSAEELFRGWMIFNDPPTHTRLRRPVATAFTPKGVMALRPEIEQMTDAILDRFEACGSTDFISSVAFPLPASVIGLLLGVEDDRYSDMRDWSKQIGSLIMGKVSRGDAWDRSLAAAEQMQSYFGDLLEHFGEHPTDNLVTRMLTAVDADFPLSGSQLVGACSLLLFGGHETTMSLIATGVYHLIQRPENRAELLARPELTELAVEELLRFDGPSKILVRRVRDDCTWHGTSMKSGQAVFCCTTAANRDPNQFEDPDAFIINRSPNRHLGFGFGMHFCLGAQLARLEAQIVIPRVLARFPRLRLACEPEELSWHPTIVGRTLRALPVRID